MSTANQNDQTKTNVAKDKQVITGADVGNLSDVLGLGEGTGTAGNGNESGTADGAEAILTPEELAAAASLAAEQTGGKTEEELTAEAAAAADQASLNAGVDAGASTLTQQAPVAASTASPAPANNQSGVVVQGEAEAATAPAVKTIPAPVVKNTTTSVTSDLDLPALVEAMKVAKPETQSALHQVIKFAEDMAPGKPQTTQSLENSQVALMVALFTILSAEDKNFNVVYRALIAIVRAHEQKCFKITMRNRGLNTISTASIDQPRMRFLTRVVDLLAVTAGLKDPQDAKKHVDMAKLLDSIANVRIKDNLVAFYS